MTTTERRKARKAALLEHVQNGTHVPRLIKSHFTQPDIAAAIVADTHRPRLPTKQRGPWAFKAASATRPPISLLAVLITVP